MKLLLAWTLTLVLLSLHGAAADNFFSENEDEIMFPREKRAVATLITGDFNICYDCDEPCQTALAADSLDATTFFTDVTTAVSTVMHAQLGIAVLFGGYKDIATDFNFGAVAQTAGATDEQKAGKINKAYWDSRASSRRSDGCESFFLVTSDDWFNDNGISGMSNMHSMCRANAYGIVKYSSTDDSVYKYTMVRRLVHEIGHQLGMFHDNAVVDNSFTTCYECANYNADVNTYCPDTGTGIMNNPETAATITFSDCSKAYTNFWGEYPYAGQYYTTSCVTAASSSGSGAYAE